MTCPTREIHKALWGYEEWLVNTPRILVKRIVANDRLSVQVHPNEVTAKTVGGDPKTEMWCVLKAGPIFAGVKPGTAAADVERAVKDGSFEDILVRHDAKVGECYFIPGGLVHAIGEGTSVYEVQQPSTTTFRLYDWGRVGADGQPRQLHVKEALAAMDLSLPPPVPTERVDCPYFTFRKVPAGDLPAEPTARVVHVPSTGETVLLAPGEGLALPVAAFVSVVKPQPAHEFPKLGQLTGSEA